MDLLNTINENAQISINIKEVISNEESITKKIRKLKKLCRNSKSPLAKAKADYYIEVLQKKQIEKIKKAVICFFSILYLIFNLCRIWWYYYPESNPLKESSLNIDIVDFIKLMFLFPIIAALYYGIKKLKMRNKTELGKNKQAHCKMKLKQ
ncbi:MAG: hypothetical protein VZR27_10890 [Acutalibacteraceae bacterium]|nr:hypothetical protein [Acutalibacteraceae bacterium]